MPGRGRVRGLSSAWGMLGVLLCAVFAAFPQAAHAADVRRGDKVEVRKGQVVQDDLYVSSKEVHVAGTVNGDLIVFARSVEVTGEVRGDLIVAAENIRVGGAVGGTMRAAGRTVDVTGSIGRDLLAAAETVQVSSDARVARDLWSAGNSVRVESPVGGEFRGTANQIRLGSEIRGDVFASTGQLLLGDNARIGGAVKYESPREAQIAAGARVTGEVVPTIVRRSPAQILGLVLLAWLRAVVALTLIGFLLSVISPRFARAAPLTIRDAPLRALGWGALAFVICPLLIILLFAIGGWWIGLIALFTFLTAVTLSFPIVGLYLGERLLHRFGESSVRGILFALVVGVAVLTLLFTVPLFGVVVVLAALMVGLGSLLLTGARLRRQPGGAPEPT